MSGVKATLGRFASVWAGLGPAGSDSGSGDTVPAQAVSREKINRDGNRRNRSVIIYS